MEAPLPSREAERLSALYWYEVLDTPPVKELDDLVHLAAFVCQAPIGVISLVDSDRQWFKSKVGLTVTQTDRVIAFCSHTILESDLLVVPDALNDPRFAHNPLVTSDPHVRFYCGSPLTTPDGYRIGTLSVIDHVPRELSHEQLETVRVLSRQVMQHLALDREHRELIQAVKAREQAVRALQLSEATFRALSETTTSGIYIYSGERFLYANPAAAAITGYSQDELRAMSLWNLVHPDFHDALKARARAVEQGETAPGLFEFQIVRKDGARRWLDFTAASIEFEGRPARIGTAYDISDRKEAEGLREVQRRVLEMVSRGKPLADTMDVLVRSIEALSDGGICSILLVDAATQALRHGALSTLPEAFCRAVDGAPIGPQNGSCGTAVYRKATVVVSDIATDPLWVPWKEAKELALRHGLKACTSVPIMSARGEVLGTYAMYYRAARGPTDFELELLGASSWLLSIAIERARTDEALRRSEERFRNIFEHASTAIAIADVAGRLVQCNPAFCALLGYTEDELRRREFLSLVHPDDRAANSALTGRLLAGEIHEFELGNRYVSKTGRAVFVKKLVTLLKDSAAPSGYVIAFVTDVTEQKQAAAVQQVAYRRLQAMSQELQRVESNERKRLSRELHDEVGQLLTGLKFDLEAVRREVVGKSSPALKRVHAKNLQALEATDQLFVRLRRIVRALRPSVLDELGLRDALYAMMSDTQARTGLICSIMMEGDAIEAKSDATIEASLYRMAQELVTNVVRHAQATRVTVTLALEGSDWLLSVQDDGIGFDPTADSISGVGLRGIRERAEIFGGRADFSSTPGAGSTVTVRIPVTTAGLLGDSV
jgi:PAS domain S-box-containing protein